MEAEWCIYIVGDFYMCDDCWGTGEVACIELGSRKMTREDKVARNRAISDAERSGVYENVYALNPRKSRPDWLLEGI